MRDTLIDIEIALIRCRYAVSRLLAPRVMVRAPVPVLSEIARREIAARQWVDDPAGFRAGVSPSEYRQRCGL